jgi:hypothetical protein
MILVFEGAGLIPEPEAGMPPDPYEYLGAWLTIAVATLGVGWAFTANGGAAGSDFAGRLIPVAAVTALRFLVFLVVPLAALAATVEHFLPQYYPGAVGDLVLAQGIDVAIYWRIGSHLGQIRLAAQQLAPADALRAPLSS